MPRTHCRGVWIVGVCARKLSIVVWGSTMKGTAGSDPAAGPNDKRFLRGTGQSHTWGVFGPASVQFNSEASDAFACKRHQRRHLEFCTALLLSRGSGVRVSPGAPLAYLLPLIASGEFHHARNVGLRQG